MVPHKADKISNILWLNPTKIAIVQDGRAVGTTVIAQIVQYPSDDQIEGLGPPAANLAERCGFHHVFIVVFKDPMSRWASMLTDASQFHNPSNYLWPATMAHGASDWAFLSEIDQKISRTPGIAIKIRDGLIPMLWFFNKNPEPANWQRKILIHHSLFRHVPMAWRDRTGVYEIGAQPRPEDIETMDELLLLGVASDNFCGLERMEQLLARIEERLAQLPAVTKLSGYIAIPPWVDHVGFQAEYFVTLARRLNRDIQFLNWYKFCGRRNLSKTFVVDLNEFVLCADNYLYQWALTHGAKSFFPLQEGYQPGEELSLYHRYYFREDPGLTPPPPADESQARIMFKIFLPSNPYSSTVKTSPFPWPKGFESWCHYLQRATGSNVQSFSRG